MVVLPRPPVADTLTTSPALAHSAVGARLAAMLNADEPVYFDAAVWTACAEDPDIWAM